MIEQLMTLVADDYTIEVGMQQSWDWKTNLTEKVINQTANPQTGTLPPILSQGAVFSGPPSDPRVYIYGGTQSSINRSSETWYYPQPDTYTLWSYAPSSDEWGQYNLATISGGSVSQRPSAGVWAEAPDQGLAFYLSGVLNNGSSYGNLYQDVQVPIQGMVVLNFSDTSPTATNASTSNLSHGNARLRGGMSYLPGFGDQGILALIGGGSTPHGTNTSWGDLVRADHASSGVRADREQVSLQTIDIFDIASLSSGDGDGWYQQNTTGNAPEPRADFCVVAASAPDNSSHQM